MTLHWRFREGNKHSTLLLCSALSSDFKNQALLIPLIRFPWPSNDIIIIDYFAKKIVFKKDE